MNETIHKFFTAYFRELEVLLPSLEANLNLLSFSAKDLLTGEESELFDDEEQFAAAADEVLYQAALAAVDVLVVLRDNAGFLSPEDRVRFLEMLGRYDELTVRWSALTEAVHEIWKLRLPPQ